MQVGKPAALPRELAEFLVEFSIALSKHAMYPSGHPFLKPSVQGVIQRLERLFLDRSAVAVGVARSQLVIEGMATDPKNPVLKELASRLHRHHLGAMTFRAGVTWEELGDLLSALSADPERGGEPLGLGPAGRLRSWEHIRLYPLSYDRLQLIQDQGDLETQTELEGNARPAQLWIGLAQAALASEGRLPVGDQEKPPDPSQVARAIQERPREKAYDQVIVGYLLQIAEELKRGGGKEAARLRSRVSELVRKLNLETLARLLQMGGDRGQRLHFVLDASQVLAAEAVIDLIAAAAAAEEETISHSMLRLLRKLGQQAVAADQKRRALADRSLREQVAALVRNWTLRNPTPEAYGQALEHVAGQDLAYESAPSTGAHPPEPMRLLQMALELDVPAATVRRAVRALVNSGELSALTAMLEGSADAETTQALWDELSSVEVLRAVLSREPLDATQLDLLVSRMGIAAADPMLDALAASPSMQSRRLLLDRIVRLGPNVAPLVLKRLKDASWYVQRNMLAILCELNQHPGDFDARPFLHHPDARVRREALRYLLKDSSTRERAIHYALADPDERACRIGLAEATERGLPDSAVPLAASLAAGSASAELRLAAIKALATNRSPQAADALLAMLPAKRLGLLRRRLFKSAESKAVLEALTRYTDYPRVRETLAKLGQD